MKPQFRMMWFYITALASTCGFAIFWSNGDSTTWTHFENFFNQRELHVNQVLSDIYAGTDMTYITDITSAASVVKVEVKQDEYYVCYVVAWFLVVVVALIQTYATIVDTYPNSLPEQQTEMTERNSQIQYEESPVTRIASVL